MYSDGKRANFTDHSLDKKPSKVIVIKTFGKTAFHTKRENRKIYSHEISKLLPILLFFRKDVNWSEEIRNHKWIWSKVARLRSSRDTAETTYGTKA
ncbi:hypothetical protein T4B_10797 [Trichinella pseudospiralis]|uniref:Uncharacterized protein n=1 Tax=Trichinella pseudospiralis TaxID=6337 RepID=A0A0V1GQV4_TRIPS|nr:hypothetical protein T4B_10797 [Trichinella pseudospiralis]KRZ39123.1 hypothetical protein T4C_8452 [Trichinella pseudospiralis]